jgi:hypothetical protein
MLKMIVTAFVLRGVSKLWERGRVSASSPKSVIAGQDSEHLEDGREAFRKPWLIGRPPSETSSLGRALPAAAWGGADGIARRRRRTVGTPAGVLLRRLFGYRDLRHHHTSRRRDLLEQLDPEQPSLGAFLVDLSLQGAWRSEVEQDRACDESSEHPVPRRVRGSRRRCHKGVRGCLEDVPTWRRLWCSSRTTIPYTMR